MSQLTLERIFADPDLNGSPPSNLQFSPCGKFIIFLKSNAQDFEQLDLWRFCLETRESQILVDASSFEFSLRTLSDEEKANRERKRISFRGIVEYFLNPDGTSIVFPLDGVLLLYHFSSEEIIQLSEESAFRTNLCFSPDGKHLSFVQNKNLFTIDLTGTEKQTQLTWDASETLSNGLAEFIAQEEMHRFEGYWWAPDSRKIAFIQVDESPVMLSQRYEIDADKFAVYDQRYPFTGTENALTRIGVIELDSGDIQWGDVQWGEAQWIELPREEGDYIARINWLPDSCRLAVQLQARNQQALKLIFHSLDKASNQCILSETSDSWINLHNDLHFLKSSDYFIWSSERNGLKQLYLFNLEGKLIRCLTSGQWMVSSLLHVDEVKEWLYFDGYLDNPLEKHLYQVSLAQAETGCNQVTKKSGWHEVVLNRNSTHYLNRFSSHLQPPQVSVHALDGDSFYLDRNALGSYPRDIDSSEKDSSEKDSSEKDSSEKDSSAKDSPGNDHPMFPFVKSLSQIEFGSIKAEDGQDLYYKLIKPTKFDPGKKYPAIVVVYGGPGAQRVTDEWMPPWYHYMTQRGYVLFQLDNRGSSNRGKEFENPIHLRLGEVEVRDQLKGVEYLSQLEFIDSSQIGVYGHSYGGYMTLMLLMKSAKSFAGGISVAPVTDWLLYDTHYTERYLGHPLTNEKGYNESSVLNQVKQIPARLLIVHGMADDNVLFTHSTKLFKKLQDMNIDFEMMNYPGAKHGLNGRQVKVHFYGLMDRFFDNCLMGES